jgi:tripartite-type tricarboxylate transporter receptor subunit TctC
MNILLSKRATIAAVGHLITCVAASSVARADGSYPSKPIELIVAFAPGGPGDVAARLVVDAMAADLGQPLVVNNVLGAGGAIGFSKAAKAKPDGYTIAIYQTSALTTGLLQKNPGYDPLNSFRGVGLIGELPFYLLSAPAVHKEAKEAIAAMRASPGKLTYASGGIGAGSHIMGEHFKSTAGVNLLHVPYKGGSEQMRALVGGEVQYTVTPLAGMEEMVKAGKIVPLASSAQKRSLNYKDVPTFAELGLPQMTVVGWIGMVAPRGTPDAVVQRLNSALSKAIARPEVRERLAKQSLEVNTSTPAELDRYIRTDTARWKQMITASDIKVD